MRLCCGTSKRHLSPPFISCLSPKTDLPPLFYEETTVAFLAREEPQSVATIGQQYSTPHRHRAAVILPLRGRRIAYPLQVSRLVPLLRCYLLFRCPTCVFMFWIDQHMIHTNVHTCMYSSSTRPLPSLACFCYSRPVAYYVTKHHPCPSLPMPLMLLHVGARAVAFASHVMLLQQNDSCEKTTPHHRECGYTLRFTVRRHSRSTRGYRVHTQLTRADSRLTLRWERQLLLPAVFRFFDCSSCGW